MAKRRLNFGEQNGEKSRRVELGEGKGEIGPAEEDVAKKEKAEADARLLATAGLHRQLSQRAQAFWQIFDTEAQEPVVRGVGGELLLQLLKTVGQSPAQQRAELPSVESVAKQVHFALKELQLLKVFALPENLTRIEELLNLTEVYAEAMEKVLVNTDEELDQRVRNNFVPSWPLVDNWLWQLRTPKFAEIRKLQSEILRRVTHLLNLNPRKCRNTEEILTGVSVLDREALPPRSFDIASNGVCFDREVRKKGWLNFLEELIKDTRSAETLTPPGRPRSGIAKLNHVAQHQHYAQLLRQSLRIRGEDKRRANRANKTKDSWLEWIHRVPLTTLDVVRTQIGIRRQMLREMDRSDCKNRIDPVASSGLIDHVPVDQFIKLQNGMCFDRTTLREWLADQNEETFTNTVPGTEDTVASTSATDASSPLFSNAEEIFSFLENLGIENRYLLQEWVRKLTTPVFAALGSSVEDLAAVVEQKHPESSLLMHQHTSEDLEKVRVELAKWSPATKALFQKEWPKLWEDIHTPGLTAAEIDGIFLHLRSFLDQRADETSLE